MRRVRSIGAPPPHRPVLAAGGATILALLAGCEALPHEGAAVTAQRTVIGSDTATAAHGTLELEAGVTAGQDDLADAPVQLKLGAGEALEVFLQASPWRRLEIDGETVDGASDLLLGSRWRFLEAEGGRPSAAVQLQTKLPTGDEDEGLSTGEVDVALAGILTWHDGPRTASAFYQLEALGDPGGGAIASHTAALIGTLAPPSGRRTGAFGELSLIAAPELDLELPFLTLGVTCNARRWLVFDLSVQLGLGEEAPDWQVLFGLTDNLGRVFTPGR